MSDVANSIMDAAERKMRLGGFNGFSYRDIAKEVGIKSSSVAYHFPSKEVLAAAVVRRYTDEVSEFIDEQMAKEPDPVKVWTEALRGTTQSKEGMCPCTVLGAGIKDLPPEVVQEVKRFHEMAHGKMMSAGLTKERAAEVFATLTGAMVLSNAMGDDGYYDLATSALCNSKKATTH